MVFQTPYYFFLSHKSAVKVSRRWANSAHWLHRTIVGAYFEVLEIENIPDGSCIIASKHQSIWECYALYALLPDAAFVLKSDLMKIPLFGWYVKKVHQIPIYRNKKLSSLRTMITHAKEKIATNRQIVIFPEGTRKSPGDVPHYRHGITKLYLELGCPVVPVALNSGLYWPRRKFLRHPGIIRTWFLKPIMPGLTEEEFLEELEKRIENACDILYLKASQDDLNPPISEKVQEKIDSVQ